MELLLNLIWLLIVAAATARFAWWSAGQKARRRYIVAVTTLCILALLFPIISVTDDLRNDPAVFEEAARRAVIIASQSMTGLMSCAIALLFSLIVAAGASRSRINTLFEHPADHLLDGVISVVAVRPPPTFVH